MTVSTNPKNDDEELQLLIGRSSQVTTISTEEDSAEVNQQKNQTEDQEENNTLLIVSFILMLIFQLGNRIFGRLQTYPMYNYPLFLNLMMIGIYVPICYLYIIPAFLFTNKITKEQTDIPKYKFAVMGAYDSLAGIMQTFAIIYITNASLIVLVQQSAIPISMIISRYALNATYTNSQYLGAAIVLLGIIAVIIPSMLGGSPSSSDIASPDSTEISEGSTSIFKSQTLWLIMLVISCVPMCLSSVYKEKALGEMEIDVIYLNGWVAIYQFLIAIPLSIPTCFIQNIPLSSVIPNMYGGMMCWMGYNTITEDYNPDNLPLDDCANAPFYVTAYLFFNVVFNFLIILILKLGSANILWMASTVIVPISNVAFSMNFMPGHQPMGPMDFVGLVIIMLGLVIYRFSEDIISLYNRAIGKEVSDLSSENDKLISKNSQKKQYKYMGINQTEHLQTLVDTRILRAKMEKLYRSPMQIRGSFLAKVGVAPSPLINKSKKGFTLDKKAYEAALASYQATGTSPSLRSLQRTNSFRSPYMKK